MVSNFSLSGLGDDLLIEPDTIISDRMSTMKSQCGWCHLEVRMRYKFISQTRSKRNNHIPILKLLKTEIIFPLVIEKG